MKKLIVLLVSISIILSGCAFIAPDEPGSSPYATDINGDFVPVHDDVDESVLDPKLLYSDERGRMKYSDETRTFLTGIDVSVFQGNINWEEVASDGIDFAILRIGYRGYGSKGIMGIDDNFYKNYDGAVNAGLKVGVYFYSQATNAGEAREEARYVLSALGDRELQMPVVYDWEYVDNAEARTANMTSEQITECAVNFCNEIELAGREVMIYFNREIGYFVYDLARINGYDFWLAEYCEYPTFIYKFNMWQYTDSGTVKGISSRVDMNIYFPPVKQADENTTQYG